MYIDKNELLSLLEQKYGDLTDECGCYVRTWNECEWQHEWLSVKTIVDIINACDEFEEEEI